MGIQLNGTSGTDVISAVDGSLTVEGLTISGDFNIADKIIHTGDTDTFIRFPAADTFTVETAGSERLRIDSSGKVTVGGEISAGNFTLENDTGKLVLGTGSDLQLFHDGGTSTIRNINNGANLELQASSTGTKSIRCYPNAGVVLYWNGETNLYTAEDAVRIHDDVKLKFGNASDFEIYHNAGAHNYLSCVTGGSDIVFKNTPSGGSTTERLRIDSNGAIRNVTTARGDFYNGSYDARGLHLEGVSGNRRGWISLVNNSNNSGESVLMFGKTRGTSAGAVTIVAANDDLGVMHFSGSDGVDLRRAAEVRAQVDGTPAVNKVGGRLMFYTTANTTDANPTERLRIDSSGFIKQKFTSNNSTTAEGLFINNLNNGTGNNASLIFSNDSGERKKAAIAHIDNGNYGHGDFVFALDGGDSGSLHLTNDERVRIKPSGVDYTLKVKGADQVEGNDCDTWSASLYFGSGATHTICTFSTGGNDSQAVATMDYAALYSYASNNRWGGQVMAIARKTSSNSSAEATNNIDAATGGSDSNIKPTFFWDVSTPGAVKLKVTTGSSVQVVGRIQVTYKDSWTLTRNYSAE